ncbi:hypothetical protein J4217_00045 [Candidatus Pacearchaeota archaeon]|nr:hypothetical protein [Candidatus Pacearchaeota archaeon]
MEAIYYFSHELDIFLEETELLNLGSRGINGFIDFMDKEGNKTKQVPLLLCVQNTGVYIGLNQIPDDRERKLASNFGVVLSKEAYAELIRRGRVGERLDMIGERVEIQRKGII